MNRYTGLSLSFCIADIMRGQVALEDVDKIIASTAAKTPKDWDYVIARYQDSYWRDFPEGAEKVVRQLIEEGKIEQPRLEGHAAHNIADGHWLIDGQLISRVSLNKKLSPRKEDALDLLMRGLETGNSGLAITGQEKAGQESFVNSTTLPTEIRGKEILEAAGVKFLGPVEGDDLFQYVELPAGWKKVATDHSMWSKLVDEQGRERASIFYKAAFYDRQASATATKPEK